MRPSGKVSLSVDGDFESHSFDDVQNSRQRHVHRMQSGNECQACF